MSARRPLGEALAELFTDDLSHCRGMLVPPGDDRPFAPAAELLSTDRLDDVLDRFGDEHGSADRRAVASLWSQWYFGTLLPPSMAASLLLGRVLPLGIDEVDVLLEEETGQPVAFRLPHGGRADPDAAPFRRFGGLLRRHLSPLVEVLAPHAGLSPDTVWTNAARYVQWTLDTLARREQRPGAAAAARRLLEAETSPDGRENPLHDTIRYVEEEGSRVARRRVCCLQYLIPDLGGCGDLCPLPGVREGDHGSA